MAQCLTFVVSKNPPQRMDGVERVQKPLFHTGRVEMEQQGE